VGLPHKVVYLSPLVCKQCVTQNRLKKRVPKKNFTQKHLIIALHFFKYLLPFVTKVKQLYLACLLSNLKNERKIIPTQSLRMLPKIETSSFHSTIHFESSAKITLISLIATLISIDYVQYSFP